MGTVHQLDAGPRDEVLAAGRAVPLDRAVDQWLSTFGNTGTARKYRQTWTPLVAELAEHQVLTVDQLDDESVVDLLAEAMTERWGQLAPTTWSARVAAVRSAGRWWQDQSYLTGDPARRLSRRPIPRAIPQPIDRADLDRLLTRTDLPLRERTLWRLLYESAARVSEVLRLDVEDLHLSRRTAAVRRKRGASDLISWRTGTARLLPRLLDGRTRGPLFLTHRRARVQLAAADLFADGRARLALRTAEDLFTAATTDEPGGPWKLHQLRHSALTHAAEDGASAFMLQAFSGHADPSSLKPYVRVSTDSLVAWQRDRDEYRR